MIRVCTASRLHFGLFSLPTAEAPSARQFGGVGLMVQEPGLHLAVRPAAAWSAEGPLAERALEFARRFTQTLAAPQPQHLLVEESSSEHSGLGTGTQLGLAVARALTEAYGLGPWSAMELARRVGRGRRSALGIHGFEQGGFLVEAGKIREDAVAPLVAWQAFPEAWRIVLVIPAGIKGLCGQVEREAFQHLGGQLQESGRTDVLCRLVLLGMLPALVEQDLPAFGEALYEFNRLVGETFRSVQKGTYAHPRGAEIVTFVRQQGVRGAGQSSWGPALFAVVEDEESAGDLGRRLQQRFRLQPGEVLVTRAANRGAQVVQGSGS